LTGANLGGGAFGKKLKLIRVERVCSWQHASTNKQYPASSRFLVSGFRYASHQTHHALNNLIKSEVA